MLAGGRFIRRVIVLLFFGAAISCAGTNREKSTSKADERAELRTQRRVDALDGNLVDLLVKSAEKRANRRTIRAILDAPVAELSAINLQHPDILRKLYKRRDDQLAWVENSGAHAALNAPGKQLIEGLERGVTRHGLWPDELHLSALQESKLVGQNPQLGVAFKGVQLSAKDRSAVKQWLKTRGGAGVGGAATDDLVALLDELLRDGNPLARLQGPVEQQAARLTKAAHQSSRLDVILSDALVQYARRMRFENPAWQKGLEWPASLREVSEQPKRSDATRDANRQSPSTRRLQGAALVEARSQYLLMEKLGAVWEDPESVSDSLAGLSPPFEPYRRLTRAFAKYADYVEAGGWPELPGDAQGLKRGATGPSVAILKKRLRIEGYYQGDSSEVFGPDLRRAVINYQKTHQLWAGGTLTPVTIRSLNVSALNRQHQIRLSMQRWRESEIGPESHFVLVNISDFHASVWRDGERKMYFAVVVGANERTKEDGEEFPRQTPRFSDKIKYIVFNPYWNVPRSIRLEESEPKQAEDPTYFEREGFEYFTASNGHRILRQKPGPTNALGKVKFLFPNKYSVYMHDTPNKGLFRNPHRAYSHGCIRIQDPMAFAHYLLDFDGRWTGERREELLEKWLAKDSETWVNLTRDLPVHIEYYVVRVDDEGRTNFLADLYRLDRPRLDKIAQKYQKLGMSAREDDDPKAQSTSTGSEQP